MRFEPARTARIRAGIPIAAVAQVAGKSGAWVYSIERGLLCPGRGDAEAIAELLGGKPEDLFSRIREELE